VVEQRLVPSTWRERLDRSCESAEFFRQPDHQGSNGARVPLLAEVVREHVRVTIAP
jgi:hypothetical protein